MEAPPVITSERPRPLWWLALLVPPVFGAVVLYWFNPSQSGFYPRCALYMTTGLYCPGCGSTRALHQLLHGHVLTALHYNLLLVLSLPVAGYYAARLAWCWQAGEPLPRLIFRPLWIKLGVAVVIAFTILRNIPGAPFNWMAPP